jgi:Pyruvate/2-oxoacid:ferredoxin oxidoreductase delta subunit
MGRRIVANTGNIQFHENLFSISLVVTIRHRERKEKKNKYIIYLIFNPEITQMVAQWMYIAADYCPQTQWLSYWASYFTALLLYKYCTNCTFCNWTVLTLFTQKLLLHVQLHNSTAHLLYKYCTHCASWNWTDDGFSGKVWNEKGDVSGIYFQQRPIYTK